MKTPMTIMKRLTVIMIVGAILALAPETSVAQSGYDLFQQALVKERADGNIEEAILLYQRIVRDFTADRALAARALVQLGRSYEKLGSTEARSAYERVLREYADQGEMAAEAGTRLAAMNRDVTDADERGIVARQLWANAAGGDIQSLSPDGRYLAFVDWSAGFGGDSTLRGHADLAIFDITSGRSRLVTNRPSQMEIDTYIADPIWSADGAYLAYTLWDITWAHQQLHIVRPDGTGDRILVANDELPRIRPMAWSPNGDFVVCVIRGWDNMRSIAIVSVKDGSVRVLKTLGQHTPWPLSLSPDGRYVVYDYWQAEGTTKHDVFLLATDGSSEIRLISHTADDERPFWTPDGQRVVFLSDRSGRRSLWAVRVKDGHAEGDPELVRPDVGQMVTLGFSRAGGLYYRLPIRVSDIHVADIDLTGDGSISSPTPLTDRFVGTNGGPAWSPDGKQIAYLSLRGAGGYGSPHAVVKSLETGEERAFALPFPTFASGLRPTWTSDGRHLLIEGGEWVGSRVSYRLNIATGKVRREAFLRDPRGMAGCFGTDGTCTFITDAQGASLRTAGLRLIGQRGSDILKRFRDGEETLRPGERILWVRNGVRRLLPGGETETECHGYPVSPRGHMHTWELSPDGTQLAFAMAADSSRSVSNLLLVMPISGDEARLADQDRRGLEACLAQRRGGRPDAELLYRSLVGSYPDDIDELARVEADQEIFLVRWTPDGKKLLFAVSDMDEEQVRGEHVVHGLWQVSVDGGPSKRLSVSGEPTGVCRDRCFADMSFSPDGSHIAFSSVETRAEIWMMEGFPWQDASRK